MTLKRESIGDGESAGNSNNSNTNSGIVVEAINAGHTLGGSCWRISKIAEDIVYAGRLQHAKRTTLSRDEFSGNRASTIRVNYGLSERG